MEGGKRGKEQNKGRIMDRGSRERQKASTGERMERSIVSSLRAENLHIIEQGERRVGVEKPPRKEHMLSSLALFSCVLGAEKVSETGEQVRAEGVMTKMRTCFSEVIFSDREKYATRAFLNER